MRRYVVPNVIIRGGGRKRWVRNPIVTAPQSILRHHGSKDSSDDNSFLERRFYPHNILNLETGSHRLTSRRLFASTTTQIDNDDSTEVFSAQTTLQQLKHIPVEAAARNFFTHCGSNDTTFDPDMELVTILKSLHDNPQTCEGFVKTLHELSTSRDDNDENSKTIAHQGVPFQPKKLHYDMVLKSWLNFNPPSVKRAEALIDYMVRTVNLPHDTETCNFVLEGWAKKSNAERAQVFFDKMIRKRIPVDLVSFSHLFKAWSKSKSPLAVNRVESILSRMENKAEIKPNAECYLRVIECWAKSKKKGSERRIEALIGMLNRGLTKDDENVDGIQQEAILNLLQVYQNIGNAHRAEEILLDFAQDFHTPTPTIEMCLSVLSTWSKSGSSRRAHRAEKLLRRMENDTELPQPDTACYTAVLNCIASSKKQGSAKSAEALLRQMDEKEVTKSNMVSLTCVLIAWARSEESDGHLQSERMFQEILDRGMKPDRYVYGGLMAAWGRSDDPDAIQKVEDYFQRLKCSEDSKPTVVEYTVLIQAYANYVSKNIDKSRESVERAESLLTEMLNSEDERLRPNSLSYAAVLKVIAAARRIPGRGERADKVLQKMVTNNIDISPYIMNIVNKCTGRLPTQKQPSPNE